jgi:hypothetical protein
MQPIERKRLLRSCEVAREIGIAIPGIMILKS